MSKLSHRLIDLTGQSFGNMVVLGRAGSNRQGRSTWLCLCVCGTEKVYSSDHLTRKTSPVKSCGCLMVKCGREHKQWKGVGDISGGGGGLVTLLGSVDKLIDPEFRAQ